MLVAPKRLNPFAKVVKEISSAKKKKKNPKKNGKFNFFPENYSAASREITVRGNNRPGSGKGLILSVTSSIQPIRTKKELNLNWMKDAGRIVEGEDSVRGDGQDIDKNLGGVVRTM